jgi:hypothetical protein
MTAASRSLATALWKARFASGLSEPPVESARFDARSRRSDRRQAKITMAEIQTSPTLNLFSAEA